MLKRHADRLLGELGEQSVLAYFDWKDDPGQLRSGLEALSSCPALSWDWAEEFLAESDGWHSGEIAAVFLEQVGEESLGMGVATVSLDTNGDAYAIGFIPVGRVEELLAVAPDMISVVREGVLD
ncbi:DUF6630 family protein [Nocardia gipuzkoensis]|uniref:DUF6630 family protein n=1 Tax=Nocardia gipuzkoensis TaxID=2749991 RepID=UPI003EE08D6D